MATLHKIDFIKEQIQITAPDHVLFIPRQREYESDNVHLYVVENKKIDSLIAFWTQSTVENAGNNHIVMSKSYDYGNTWSTPKFLLGSRSIDGSDEPQASWGFPIVSRSGRIYLFYFREIIGEVDTSRQLTAKFSAIYSDDCGETWSESRDIPLAKTRYDKKADIQDNIVFQLPMRCADGVYIAGFTKYVSKTCSSDIKNSTRVYFFRFENIDDDPEIEFLNVKILPENDGEGIFIDLPSGKKGRIEEPAFVNLPDGRIFCSMRTNLGTINYSVSSDFGKSWTDPEPLCFSDHSVFVHPLSPCPIWEIGEGRYMQLYHGCVDAKRPYFPRNPIRIAIGRFDPLAKQPIVFDKSEDDLYMELSEKADGLGYGVELAIYGSMTNVNGKRIMWYPDRKFFLLGKDIDF